ncbi:exodeoxyribonuclease VII small subunit [Nocardiopsis oceani]
MPETSTDQGANGGAGDSGSPELSYEESRDELNNVVRKLESGGLTLQESLKLWERGEELARTCEQWLEGARAKLAAAMDERRGDEPGDGDTPF